MYVFKIWLQEVKGSNVPFILIIALETLEKEAS